MAKTYAESGVDIEAGNRFAQFIRSINSPAVNGDSPIPGGGFASGFDLDMSEYVHPVILSSTDGVGTKLLVAEQLGVYDTIGIDLVAMCVNDLIVHGAQPKTFLDYIACAAIDRTILDPIVEGIVRGCERAGCTLSGGETAELPGIYEPGRFDLAGFAIGVAEKADLLPATEWQPDNARLFGLPSSGIHSNGLSLARSVVSSTDSDTYHMLLEPTRIYVSEVMRLIDSGCMTAAAHITGGGLEGNIARVLPEGFAPELTYEWPRPPVFDRIGRGGVAEPEMRKVFNLGIGFVCVVPTGKAEEFAQTAERERIDLIEIGHVRRV